jgi:hypothetical protein
MRCRYFYVKVYRVEAASRLGLSSESIAYIQGRSATILRIEHIILIRKLE